MPESEKFNDREQYHGLSESENLLFHFGLSWKDLRGRKVLEVGASYAALAAEGKRKGLGDIVSLDFHPYEEAEERGNYIRGAVEHLPFQQEYFDIVISSRGPLSPWGRSNEELKVPLQESWKVLKPGGRVFIWPAWIEKHAARDKETVAAFIDEKKKFLEKLVGEIFDVKILYIPAKREPYFGGDYSIELVKKS